MGFLAHGVVKFYKNNFETLKASSQLVAVGHCQMDGRLASRSEKGSVWVCCAGPLTSRSCITAPQVEGVSPPPLPKVHLLPTEPSVLRLFSSLSLHLAHSTLHTPRNSPHDNNLCGQTSRAAEQEMELPVLSREVESEWKLFSYTICTRAVQALKQRVKRTVPRTPQNKSIQPKQASRSMRNIETFPTNQMYLCLSLVERKVAEFNHNMVKMTYFHHFFRTIDGVLG